MLSLSLLQNRIQTIDVGYGCYLTLINLSYIKNTEFILAKSFLNHEENLKCEKFVDLVLSYKYAVYRFLAKNILANFLNKDISQISFEYHKFGKPYLKDTKLNFNISHTKDFAVIALNRNIEVGVDIEFIDYQFNYLSVLEICASNNEISWVTKKNSIERFYQLWTTKESILKCSGIGMMGEKFPLITIKENNLLHYGYKIINLELNHKYYISICVNCSN